MNGSARYVGSIIISSNSPRELKIEKEIYNTGERGEIKDLRDIIGILKSLKSSNKFYSQKIKIKYNERENKLLIEERINVKSSRNEEAQYLYEEHAKISLECREVEQSCENIKAILETQYNTERSLKSLDRTIDTVLRDVRTRIQTISNIIENLNNISKFYKTKSNNCYQALDKIIKDIEETLKNYVEIYENFVQNITPSGYL